MKFERIEVRVPASRRGHLPEIVAQTSDGGANWTAWTVDGGIWEVACELVVTDVVFTTPRGTKRTKRAIQLGLRDRRLPETIWLEGIVRYDPLRAAVGAILREVRRGAWWGHAIIHERERCEVAGINPYRVMYDWDGGGRVPELAALQRARLAKAAKAEVAP